MPTSAKFAGSVDPRVHRVDEDIRSVAHGGEKIDLAVNFLVLLQESGAAGIFFREAGTEAMSPPPRDGELELGVAALAADVLRLMPSSEICCPSAGLWVDAAEQMDQTAALDLRQYRLKSVSLSVVLAGEH